MPISGTMLKDNYFRMKSDPSQPKVIVY